jgi:hypothetical protein
VLRVFHVNVSKLDLNILMLQILIFDVAIVEFRYRRRVMLGVVLRGRREDGP